MHEPSLERIRDLERAVRRWRLACLALTLVVVSLLAIGGTFGVVLMLDGSNRREIEMALDREQAARAQADEAMREAHVLKQQLEQTRLRALDKGRDELVP
jgi:hypothetical protein